VRGSPPPWPGQSPGPGWLGPAVAGQVEHLGRAKGLQHVDVGLRSSSESSGLSRWPSYWRLGQEPIHRFRIRSFLRREGRGCTRRSESKSFGHSLPRSPLALRWLQRLERAKDEQTRTLHGGCFLLLVQSQFNGFRELSVIQVGKWFAEPVPTMPLGQGDHLWPNRRCLARGIRPLHCSLVRPEWQASANATRYLFPRRDLWGSSLAGVVLGG
jgi:hypothetical protein